MTMGKYDVQGMLYKDLVQSWTREISKVEQSKLSPDTLHDVLRVYGRVLRIFEKEARNEEAIAYDHDNPANSSAGYYFGA
ncbi:MAG: hypothetical protein MN733_18710 [Nitrososphaera sp.]|nr:hypothetical protein [Nitrososphaera sp.]